MVFLRIQSESTPFNLSTVTIGDHMVDIRHDAGLQSSLFQCWKHLRRKCHHIILAINRHFSIKKNNWMLHPPTFLLFIITPPAVSAEQDSRSLFNHFYLVQTHLLQSDLKCWCWVSSRNLLTRKGVRINSANQYILNHAYKSVCL